jgi:hypothetical protein
MARLQPFATRGIIIIKAPIGSLWVYSGCDKSRLYAGLLHAKCCFRHDYFCYSDASPHMLLSMSLFSLLVGIGIYLGYVWTRKLDISAGPNSSRNVMIVYILSGVICLLVYSGFSGDSGRRYQDGEEHSF